MDKLRDYFRISQAAEFLGVSPGTLRNWEQQGKIRAHRVPQNGYRLFRRADLEEVLQQVSASTAGGRRASTTPRPRRRVSK